MSKILQKVQDLSFDLRYISDLASNTPGCLRADLGQLNFPLSPMIGEIINQLSSEQKAYSYAPTFGDPELLEVLQTFNARYLINYEKPKTLVTSGGQAALFAVFHSLIRKGDEVVCDLHYYPPYSNLARLTESTLSPMDLSDPDSLSDKNIRMLIVNSPNNPSGKMYRRETLEKLADLARKNDWIILEDVVYDRIYFEDEPESISQFCSERTLVINSASKNFCMPGARIGWLSGPEEMINNIAKLHRNMNSCPNAFFQRLLAKFIPHSDSFFNDLRMEMKIRRDLSLKLFDDFGWGHSRAEGAIYAMARIPGLENSIALVERMIREAKVSVMPGAYFGGHDDQLRICYGAITKEQIIELKEKWKKFNF